MPTRRALVLGLALLATSQSALPAGTRAPGARSVTDVYVPGAETVWVFARGEEEIGHHVLRYEGPLELVGVGAHRFTARVHMNAMPALNLPEQRYTAELVTNGAGHVLRHRLLAQLGTTRSEVELIVRDGRGDARIVQGTGTTKMDVDVPRGAFIQANNFIGYLELMLALDPVESDERREYPWFSTNALKALPYRATWSKVKRMKVGGRPRNVTVIKDSLGEVVSIDDAGRVLEVALPAQGITIRRSDEAREPFVIAAPQARERSPDLDTEEITIEHGQVSLAGTVTRPRDAAGRLPAIFFVSGSGTQDRDGFSSGIDVGTHEILDRLTLDGFLVLRVDDRGIGGSVGPTAGMGYAELVDDARACVDHLLERDDVDPHRVAVIGHSEGGVTATILAVERPRLAAIVLMASSGRPLTEVILDQNADALERNGVVGAERDRILAEVADAIERVCGDPDLRPAEIAPDYRELFSMRAWLCAHAEQDPSATLRSVRCPVLLLQGAKDFQVSPERDAQRLAAALEESEHPDHQLVVFAGLDHLFKRAPGETSELADYYEDRRVDAEFQRVLSTWLRERLMPETER